MYANRNRKWGCFHLKFWVSIDTFWGTADLWNSPTKTIFIAESDTSSKDSETPKTGKSSKSSCKEEELFSKRIDFFNSYKKLKLYVVSQCNSLFKVSLCYLVWSNLSFELQPLLSTSANDHIFEFLRTFEIKSIFLESRDSTRKTLLNESVEDRDLVVR